jgi:dTDP-4-dehydrorhamnose reductase
MAVILRVPLLSGNSLTAQRSLHERLFTAWAAGKTPQVYTDEYRQPCSADNLAELMVEILERNDVRGLFHWAGADLLSRHELARRIRAHFKLSDTAAPLAAIHRGDHARAAAKRPARLGLDLKPLAGVVKTPIETFAAQLDQFIIPPACRAWYFSA